ncbi:hypothetical protein JCM10908_000070 [Rhodotorula pacifica]|uniref:uncharacterized protein n=1 Tax=Rhodotorula pacifica TaxID=1495444 RepID=UPI00316F3977
MPLTELRRPDLPSHILPRLPRSLDGSELSSEHLLSLVNHLRILYASTDEPGEGEHAVDSETRSAQPSAEQVSASKFQGVTVIEDETIDPLWQHDAFERTWTINWLNLIVRRGEEWTLEAEAGGDAQELQRRHDLVDKAASLVGVLTATTEGGSILRPLLLPTCPSDAQQQTEPLLITLNDALPSSLDPTSVGLQSWGSSIILARMIALEPHSFGLGEADHRVLELGAGTGLLSLVWKAMSERLGAPCEMFATDYHEGVLDNLRKNVETNSAAITPITSPTDSPALRPRSGAASGPHSSSSSSSLSSLPVQTHKLDWSAVHSSRAFSALAGPGGPMEISMPPPFDKPFHTILAADVVYGPTHAEWLKSCVEQFLIKPDAVSPSSSSSSPPTTDKLSEDVVDLSLGEPTPRAKTVALPTRPDLHSTDSSAAFETSQPSHIATTTTTSGSNTRPQTGYRPAFHLIVPLRPTHAEAIASIDRAFPKKEDLPPRRLHDDEPWRVAIEEVTEIERVHGVGRSDEETYRLFRIGWC